MNLDMKNFTTATVLSVAMFGSTFIATAPANATHKIGHAIVGGVIGGIIGGAIVNGVRRRQQPVYVTPQQPVYIAPQQPVYVAPAPRRSYNGLPPQHYNWCYNNYRSYHQASNTFQPYNGGRRQCRSPWW